MCKDCGCSEALTKLSPHPQKISFSKEIILKEKVLQKNDDIAEKNRRWFHEHKMKVINLISSPGSGKTLLLEKTLEALNEKKKISLLVGDQQTDNDAQRLLKKSDRVKQINTYSSCHLDAQMIEKELGVFVKGDEELLIIENIGNLVCPSAFDLGEDHKIALLSSTEGEDKPEKYPVLFNTASLVIITKMDLVPHLDWDIKKAHQSIRKVNPNISIIELSAKTGEGLKEWFHWLTSL